MSEDGKGKKRKFTAGNDYSRGSSGKGLREKFATETQVRNRIARLGQMIKDDVLRIAQYKSKLKRKIGAAKKEAERLLVIAEEREYESILETAKEGGFDGLKAFTTKRAKQKTGEESEDISKRGSESE